MISINECKNNWLYIIKARNASLGIYKKENKSFIISRTKFRNKFIFEEIHWDACETFGTAKPIKALFEITKETLKLPEKDLITFLDNEFEKRRKEINESILKDIRKNKPK